MAGFGTHGYHHPRRCDPQPVEAFAPVRASHLAARGAFVGPPGSTTGWAYPGFVLTVTIEHTCRIIVSIDHQEQTGVGIVRQGFGQLLFVCPSCTRWRRNLYVKDGVLACRRCNRLDYSSRHRHRSDAARAVNLATKVRHRLGADSAPFGPLPPRPGHHGSARVYDRLVARLAALESRALMAFADTLAAVERRARKRKRPR